MAARISFGWLRFLAATSKQSSISRRTLYAHGKLAKVANCCFRAASKNSDSLSEPHPRGCASDFDWLRVPFTLALEISLNHNPLDLIEAELVAPPIIELRCPRRGWFAIAASVPLFLKIGRDRDRSSGPAVRLSVEHVGTAAPTKPCRAERIAVRAYPPV